MPTNRPITTDFDSWMRDQERRTTSLERRARHSTRQFAPGEVPPPLGTPYAKRYHFVTSAAAVGAIGWDTPVALDSGMTWDAANKWFVVPKQGLYHVHARIGLLLLGGQFPSLQVQVNTVATSQSFKKPDEQWNEITDVVRCAAGDNIRITAQKTGGGAFSFEGGSDLRSYVTIAWIGETV